MRLPILMLGSKRVRRLRRPIGQLQQREGGPMSDPGYLAARARRHLPPMPPTKRELISILRVAAASLEAGDYDRFDRTLARLLNEVFAANEVIESTDDPSNIRTSMKSAD
jgi:hypothetical protein